MPKPSNPALQAGNPLAAGLVRCYPLHEGTGQTLHDLAPGARDATHRAAGSAAAAAWGTDPTYGAIITLNGTDQEAVAPDAGMPAGAAPRTVAFLFRAAQDSDGRLGFLLGYGDSGDGLFAAGIADDQTNDGDDRQGLCVTTATHNASGTEDLTGTGWRLGVATLDGSTDLRLYLDGSPISNAAGNASAAFAPVATALAGTMFLGSAGGSLQSLRFRGDVAGWWAWGRALSPSEVASFAADPWQMLRPPARTVFMFRF